MLKRIVIPAGFVIGLIASVVGGWTAGEWYYGEVKLEDIEALFRAAEKEKSVEIVTK